MPDYDNSNSAFIGTNKRKRPNSNDPDISGSGLIGGVEYWISGWKNSKGYGLKFKPKDGARPHSEPVRGPQTAPARTAPAPAGDIDEDDIPF